MGAVDVGRLLSRCQADLVGVDLNRGVQLSGVH